MYDAMLCVVPRDVSRTFPGDADAQRCELVPCRLGLKGVLQGVENTSGSAHLSQSPQGPGMCYNLLVTIRFE